MRYYSTDDTIVEVDEDTISTIPPPLESEDLDDEPTLVTDKRLKEMLPRHPW